MTGQGVRWIRDSVSSCYKRFNLKVSLSKTKAIFLPSSSQAPVTLQPTFIHIINQEITKSAKELYYSGLTPVVMDPLMQVLRGLHNVLKSHPTTGKIPLTMFPNDLQYQVARQSAQLAGPGKKAIYPVWRV